MHILSKLKKTSLALAVGTMAILGATSTVHAEELSKSDVESIIAEYLKNNPEVILDSLDSYRQKEEKERREMTEKNIDDQWNSLISETSPSIGASAKDAKVTIIEFFDYNCGYCKRALPDIQEIVEKNDDVRVVFKEMPILSPGSTEAAKWAMAAHKHGKYFEYHSALMNHRGPKNEKELQKIAKNLDLHVDDLTKDAQSDAVANQVEAMIALGRKVGVQGTPAFIINKKFYPGYLGPDGFANAIEEARK